MLGAQLVCALRIDLKPLPAIDLAFLIIGHVAAKSITKFRMDSKLVLQGSIAMELTRLTARIAAGLLIVTAGMVIGSPSAHAQSGPIRLTSSDSTVNHQISQTVERLEMLVKSSRILTLEDRIPRFQVHNEEIVGATPVSQNQIQIFAKGPGTTQLNLWDTNDKLYTVDVTVMGDAREVEGILSVAVAIGIAKVHADQRGLHRFGNGHKR